MAVEWGDVLCWGVVVGGEVEGGDVEQGVGVVFVAQLLDCEHVLVLADSEHAPVPQVHHLQALRRGGARGRAQRKHERLDLVAADRQVAYVLLQPVLYDRQQPRKLRRLPPARVRLPAHLMLDRAVCGRASICAQGGLRQGRLGGSPRLGYLHPLRVAPPGLILTVALRFVAQVDEPALYLSLVLERRFQVTALAAQKQHIRLRVRLHQLNSDILLNVNHLNDLRILDPLQQSFQLAKSSR